jgi:hypothetical protein
MKIQNGGFIRNDRLFIRFFQIHLLGQPLKLILNFLYILTDLLLEKRDKNSAQRKNSKWWIYSKCTIFTFYIR